MEFIIHSNLVGNGRQENNIFKTQNDERTNSTTGYTD